ncbi:hypothetical protein T484DRAFT_1947588 [Baffinella frigidus]|nr:hypothetical protein T484DRAFT_1947588 [Cryptophyta sp. CCMP2293]
MPIALSLVLVVFIAITLVLMFLSSPLTLLQRRPSTLPPAASLLATLLPPLKPRLSQVLLTPQIAVRLPPTRLARHLALAPPVIPALPHVGIAPARAHLLALSPVLVLPVSLPAALRTAPVCRSIVALVGTPVAAFSPLVHLAPLAPLAGRMLHFMVPGLLRQLRLLAGGAVLLVIRSLESRKPLVVTVQLVEGSRQPSLLRA